MKPINIDSELHKKMKRHAVDVDETMYQLMNRYVQLGLWYDSLEDNVKKDISKEVQEFHNKDIKQ